MWEVPASSSPSPSTFLPAAPSLLFFSPRHQPVVQSQAAEKILGCRNGSVHNKGRRKARKAG